MSRLMPPHVRPKPAPCLRIDLIPVAAIRSGKLLRDRSRVLDPELGDLKASIRAVGLSNPIRVEPDGQGGYELIQGWRRLTAWRELRAETGSADYDTIPAGLMPPGDTMETLYRRMVDENLVRKDVSFAEMARLARACAEDGVGAAAGDSADVDAAVNLLFGSAPPQKRSYIRRFARLMQALEKHLEHPEAIPRALGLALADRIDADPAAVAGLVRQLQAAPGRDAEAEQQILRRFAEGARTAPHAKPRAARRGRPQARVMLCLPVGPGVRCTAADGRLDLRAEIDFGAIDPARLETAIAALLRSIGRA